MSCRGGVLGVIVVGALSMGPGPTAAGEAQGSLLIIGGGTRGDAVLGKLVELAGGPRARIAVLPMASSTPEETGSAYVEELTRAGAGSAFTLNVTREEADSDAAVARLDGATGIFFTGGDQVRHTRALLGSRLLERIHELHRGGAAIAGTSAGAAVMSRIMITGEERRPHEDRPFDRVEADEVATSEGLSFLPPDVIVDQHFVVRRRNNRLLSVVLEGPGRIGLGVNEGAALWVRPDETFEVLGDGPVIVYDAGDAEIERAGWNVAAAGLRVHVLGSGSTFDLRARKVVRLRAAAR